LVKFSPKEKLKIETENELVFGSFQSSEVRKEKKIVKISRSLYLVFHVYVAKNIKG
jgi:hypothetical protein